MPGCGRPGCAAVGPLSGWSGSTAAAGLVIALALLVAPSRAGFVAGHAVVTVSWVVVALVLLARGVRRPALRVAGLVLVAAAVAKLVLFDLVALDGLPGSRRSSGRVCCCWQPGRVTPGWSPRPRRSRRRPEPAPRRSPAAAPPRGARQRAGPGDVGVGRTCPERGADRRDGGADVRVPKVGGAALGGPDTEQRGRHRRIVGEGVRGGQLGDDRGDRSVPALDGRATASPSNRPAAPRSPAARQIALPAVATTARR